jgi:hypothetical protein
MEIETRSFQTQEKYFVLSQCYAVTVYYSLRNKAVETRASAAAAVPPPRARGLRTERLPRRLAGEPGEARPGRARGPEARPSLTAAALPMIGNSRSLRNACSQKQSVMQCIDGLVS